MADAQGPRSGSADPRPPAGGFASSLGAQTLRGAVLVLVAVVVGVILLNVVDDGTVSSTTKTTAAADKPDRPAKTTTTTAPAAAKPASEVKLVVLNGGGPVGAAGSMSEKLRAAGYTNQGQPADATNRGRTGNYAFCAQGLRAELSALAKALTEAGGGVAAIDAIGLPDGEAASTQGYDCVVVVGG